MSLHIYRTHRFDQETGEPYGHAELVEEPRGKVLATCQGPTLQEAEDALRASLPPWVVVEEREDEEPVARAAVALGVDLENYPALMDALEALPFPVLVKRVSSEDDF